MENVFRLVCQGFIIAEKFISLFICFTIMNPFIPGMQLVMVMIYTGLGKLMICF